MENSNYSVYIIGTPTNSDGFKHKTLTPNDVLKKDYAQYLYKFDSNNMKEGYSYVIKKQTVDNNKFTILSLFRKLDVVNNRGGAYIGIAIVIDGDISLNDSILYYQILSEVNGHLSAYIVDNKLIDGFTMEHYKYPIDKVLDATYLLDMLSKASKETQSGQLGTITYNTENHPNTVYKDQTFDTTPFKEKFEEAKKETEKQRDEANRKLTSMTKDYNSSESSKKSLSTELTKYKNSYTLLDNKLKLTEKSENQAVSDLKEAKENFTVLERANENYKKENKDFIVLERSNKNYKKENEELKLNLAKNEISKEKFENTKEEFENTKEEFKKAKKDILLKQTEVEKQRDEANRKLKSEIRDHKSAEDSRQALATELTKFKQNYILLTQEKNNIKSKLELTEKSKNQAVSDLKEANNKIVENDIAKQVTGNTETAIDFNNLPKDNKYVMENNKLKTEIATFKKKEEDTRLKYLDEKATKKKELLDAYTATSKTNETNHSDNTQNENKYHKDLKDLNKKYTLLNNVHLKYLEDLEDATKIDKEKIKTEYNAKIQEITDGKTKEAFSLDLDSVIAILLAVIIFISIGFLFLKMDDIEQRMTGANQTEISTQDNNKTDFIDSDVSWNDKNISSSYYDADNFFRGNTDVWFVYGRILETNQANIEKLKTAFTKKNNIYRYPINWTNYLEINKATPKNQIKAGMIVITTCTENGEVGFIEQVSKNNYNISTYIDKKYNNSSYNIDNTINSCTPKFYDLEDSNITLN